MYYLLKKKQGKNWLYIHVETKKHIKLKWVDTFNEASKLCPQYLKEHDITQSILTMKGIVPQIWATDVFIDPRESDFNKIDDNFLRYWTDPSRVAAIESVYMQKAPEQISVPQQRSEQVEKFVARAIKTDEYNNSTFKSFDEIPAPFPVRDFQEIIRSTNDLCDFDSDNHNTKSMVDSIGFTTNVDLDVDTVLKEPAIQTDSATLVRSLIKYRKNSSARKEQLKNQIAVVQQGIADIVQYLTAVSNTSNAQFYIRIGTVLQQLLVARNSIKREYAELQLIDKFISNPNNTDLQSVFNRIDTRTYQPRVLTELFSAIGKPMLEIDSHQIRDNHPDILPKDMPVKKEEKENVKPKATPQKKPVKVHDDEAIQRTNFKVDRIISDDQFPYYYRQLKGKKLLKRYVADVYHVSMPTLSKAVQTYEKSRKKRT